MFDLFVKGGSLVDRQHGTLSAKETQKQIFQGIGIAFKKWWLVLRCSAIGTTIGIIPGLGSAPAAFIAYGHAKQTSRSKETFGKGNIEGVIGSEAANDAVEGGALASTVAFGIPGSSSMAILLGGLFILGLETGVDMVTTDVDIVFVMIFTVIFGNFIGTIFGMFLVNPMARATSIRASIMVPILIAVVVTGAYAAQGSLVDIVVALVFGVFGYLMKILNYSRAALLIGYVLGHAVEKNLYLATQLKGNLFFLSPIPLSLCLITIGFIAYNIYGLVSDQKKR